ncbi:MAG: DUF4153 domain-containing protein [Rhodobacteraceae bacterium]|nr:DUF4153 domain-containing protein [Paracoccaceae bacterium]
MSFRQANQIAIHRLFLAIFGAGAGLALWLLTDNWDSAHFSPALYLAIFVFVLVYSLVVLALVGPLGFARALPGGLLLAVPVTILASMAGLRFVTATDLFDNGIMVTVILMLVLIATPFLSCWLTDRKSWLHYEVLFDTAWVIAVRYIVAWVFVGVFWLVLFLSDALLKLVDVRLLQLFVNDTWATVTLTGAVLGLAMAVVYELRAMISPYLILRLLRLMVPPVLAVLAIFLAAIPLRGLTGVFGGLSSGATLMAAAIVGISLVATALDRDDAVAVKTRGIRLATQGLAVLLPLLTALAVWSVVLRVQQYGWTPERVLAGLIAGFLLVYGVAYAAAVVMHTNWMARIRRINVVMAMAVIVVSALWMTPFLNAYRIAANSQLTLFEQGDISVSQLALWEMEHEWGRVGQAGIRSVEVMKNRPDHVEIAEKINAVRTETSRYRANRVVEKTIIPKQSETLVSLLPTRPESFSLGTDAFVDLQLDRVNQWLDGCQRTLPDGRAGCVLILGEFTPGAVPESEAMLLYTGQNNQGQAHFVALNEGKIFEVKQVFDPVSNTWARFPTDAIAKVLDGGFKVQPRQGSALHVGGQVLEPAN